MAKFSLFDIYDIYATSRSNYLELANDPAFPNIVVPQIKAQRTIFIRRLPPAMANRAGAVWSGNGREFIDNVMSFVARELQAYDDNSTQYVLDIPGLMTENMEAVEIEMANADFLKMSSPAQSVLTNLQVIPQFIDTRVPSGIFTQEPEKYRHTAMPVYSGIDINIIFLTPNVLVKNTVIKTLSYSSHIDANEVTVLGRSYPKGYTDGRRTIAGSMIGTLSVNDPLVQLHPEWFDGDIQNHVPFQDLFKPYLLTDQLPLFDILILFENEYGFMSAFTIFGVKVPDHGVVMSVDDSVIEVTYQYKAMDVDMIREIKGETVEEDYLDPEDGVVKSRTVRRVVDILANDEYILKHNTVVKGQSLHRSTLDVPYLWDEMWDNINEINFLKKHVPAYKFGLLTKPGDFVE